jgi:polyphosphate kinase 2 (PPK2 family)
MNEVKPNSGAKDWLEAELEDTLDEDYELELSEPALSLEIAKIYKKSHPPSIERMTYFRELLRLQSELIKLQSWVAYHKKKLVVIFEGRDSAGKGGVIKRITQRLNPRIARVVALPAPTEREKSQWYFQRYVPHLPAGGEIVLFDRSWYNRSGVERVMGFANEDQVEEFFRDVPEFERMLVRSGITLVKYWFSISRWTCSRACAGSSTPRPRKQPSPAPTSRKRPGSSSRATTRSGRGSTASTTCCGKCPTRMCRMRRSRCRSGCSIPLTSARCCRASFMCRRSIEAHFLLPVRGE